MMTQQNHHLSGDVGAGAPQVVATGEPRSKEDHRPASTVVDVADTTIGTVTPINDNSNPQSGTSRMSTEPAAANNDVNAKNSTKQMPSAMYHQQPRKVSSADTAATSSSTAPSPSTVSNHGNYNKDARKLFVGGLPQDSEYRQCQGFGGDIWNVPTKVTHAQSLPFAFLFCRSHGARVSILLCSVWRTARCYRHG